MKIVAGLGNPDAKYNFTRHNVGFLALDYYLKRYHINWNKKPRFGAIVGTANEVLFVKPQLYYNLSGKPIAAFKQYYEVPEFDVLVICDDFNLKFGEVRFRNDGTAGGNNGLKSVIQEMDTKYFPRIRIGTGNDELRKQMGDADFVLSRFTSEEKERLPEILETTLNKIDDFVGL